MQAAIANRRTETLRNLDPLLVHPLPAAPTFTGRETELERHPEVAPLRIPLEEKKR